MKTTELKNIVSVMLLGLLVGQSMPGQQPEADTGIKQSIGALPPDARVELGLTNGSWVRGRILSRADLDFAFQRDKGCGAQNISYDQVRSVSQVKTRHSKRKWIIVSVVAGVVVTAVVIGVLVLTHPVLVRI